MPGGAVIMGQECDSDLTVTVRLQTPLLYWRERSRWMWHKKWSLPRIFVSVDVGAGVPLDRPLLAMISCGTLVAGDSELHDQVPTRPPPPFPAQAGPLYRRRARYTARPNMSGDRPIYRSASSSPTSTTAAYRRACRATACSG